MFSSLIRAELVYANTSYDKVRIPNSLGSPREDQMQGTQAEQLIELAGRTCYDSLGKGRPSFTQEVVTGVDPHTGEQLLETVEGYHDHIKTVNHGSVWEHFNATVCFPRNAIQMLMAYSVCCNRPGVFVSASESEIRITTNPRAVREWSAWTHLLMNQGNSSCSMNYLSYSILIEQLLRKNFHQLAPHIVDEPMLNFPLPESRIGLPMTDHERWVSLFVSGSRGMSHELVRHGDFTAISQRSTRYVDENESPWVSHPLLSAYINQLPSDNVSEIEVDEVGVEGSARELYGSVSRSLEKWLLSKGVDKLSARKQARGAARGYLGNALYTELIFSASVAQWKRILLQRGSVHADAEIRVLATEMLQVLTASPYGECFNGYTLARSPDGIGSVVELNQT